ncbi:MAG: class I SAM-dependent methyltransferase [Inquilinus sp.]|nr:class I SAM-dependent methyltransferase [Inquilinus sp.]
MSEFDRWEQRFAAEDYLFGTAPNAFLAAQAPLLVPGRRALSIADGEGRNGVWLAERGLSVQALDFSPTALAKARDLAAARGVAIETERADLFAWDWPDAAFDVIVGIFFQFAPPAERTVIFEGIRKALKPGGLLLIQGYRPEQLVYATGGPKAVEQLYTRELLEAAFGDFATLEIREHDSEVAEGAGHHGMSALIDLVGRK